MTTHYKNWNEIPVHLATKTALSREGLRPNGRVVGTYFKRSTCTYIDLYDRNEAMPKRKMSEKQQLALEKAREKTIQQRTCTRCTHTVQHKNKLKGGLCSSCIKNLAEIQQIEEQRESCKNKINYIFNNKNKFLVLDTQTTGLGENDEIIEIAVTSNLDGKTLLNTLVRPTVPISNDATMIHGITNEIVEKGQPWSDVYKQLCDIVANKILLIYNADFDLSMIQQTCLAHNIDAPNFKSRCMMELYATYIDSERWYSLEEAIEHRMPHKSLDRCFALLLLIQK
jgi:DNA polymerase-3 subunit epsilon